MAIIAAFWSVPGVASTGGSQNLPADVTQMVQRANEATQRGDLRVATLLLKNAVQAAPRQAAVRAQLGNVLAMQGDMPEAERTLRQARSQGAPDSATLPALYQAMLGRHEGQALLTEFPEPPPQDRSAVTADTLRARALAEYSLGDLAAANGEIDKALAIRRTAPSLVNKAEFALARGDRMAAQGFIDEALHIAPQDFAALVMKIGILERGDDYPAALTFADALVKVYASQPLPRVLRVEILAKLHQDSRAETDVNWLLTASPNLPIALYDRALLKARKGDVKGAWQIAQALPPEFLHTSPQFGLGAAQIAQASGNAEVSDTLLLSIISYYPDNEEARLLLAAKRLQQKNPNEALELLKPLKANDPRFLSLMAQTYQALGQKAQAQDYSARANLAAVKSGNQPASMDRLSAANLANPADAEIAGTLISILIQQGNEQQAQQVADRFAAAAKTDPMVPYFRGQLMMAHGDLDGAAQAFSATLKAKPGYAPALFYRSQAAAARGDQTAAEADLDLILQADAANTQALAKKAQYALQWGHDAEAESYLKAAVAAVPHDPAPQLALAEFYLSRKNYAKAQAVAATLLRQSPNDARAANTMVRVQLAQGQLMPAKTTASNFAHTAQNAEASGILLGDVLDRAKDPGALAAYNNAVRAGHDSQAANMALINYYARNGNSTKAVEAARAFAGRHPGLASDILLAQTLVAAGQTAQAKTVLQNAMSQARDEQSVLALARLEGQLDSAKAEDILSAWLKTHADDTPARTQLATLYIADGNLEAARRQLEPIVKLQPYNVSALNDLAWTLQKADSARALKLAATAAKISPQSGEVLDTLAWLKWQQNAKPESLALLRQAHALSPQEPNIDYHLAVVLQASGDRANAEQILQAALKANPSARNSAEVQRLEAQWH